MRFRLFSFIVIIYFTFGCANNKRAGGETVLAGTNDTAVIDGHPAWIEQGNIYEVNVRQYTPEGTFAAFSKHLDRLKEMGVQTLWFMPINPISKKDRKGALGSYYAVSGYTSINPEFGTMEDWKTLVRTAHDKGFKVIMDWVPNHTGADHPWLASHPEFYVRDSVTHLPVSPFDWTDVRQLDFTNQQMQDSMLEAMKFWITETDIDGYRCDHVEEFQKAFWVKCIPELRKLKNIFMLAEVNAPWVYQSGFDATYPWDAFNMMKMIAKGERPASGMDSILQKEDSSYAPNAIRVYFTSNHDENSWNRADWQTMPGAVHAPFAVLTQTIERSVPLIYSGQEEPFLDSVRFFYKDTITFGRFKRAPFYRTLLNLRKTNPALAANASYRKLHTNNDAALFAFEREKDGNKVLVILNLSKNPQQIAWKDQPSEKEWNNVFAGSKEPVDKGFGIEPWGYAVYELRK
ncbi:MAG TPA: alpha-amylase family glycosyl hydrolase [Flavisolibacter sp.]|nr:alpha-amylase family glycosyl hydrolase [Flavisolibacter sp.]